MVEDALAGTDWLVVEDAAQSGRYSKRQLVRSGMSQTDGQAALWVCVKNQEVLSLVESIHSDVDENCYKDYCRIAPLEGVFCVPGRETEP